MTSNSRVRRSLLIVFQTSNEMKTFCHLAKVQNNTRLSYSSRLRRDLADPTLRTAYLPGVLREPPLVGLKDLLASGELELRTPKGLYCRRAVVVLRPDRDDDLDNGEISRVNIPWSLGLGARDANIIGSCRMELVEDTQAS